MFEIGGGYFLKMHFSGILPMHWDLTDLWIVLLKIWLTDWDDPLQHPLTTLACKLDLKGVNYTNQLNIDVRNTLIGQLWRTIFEYVKCKSLKSRGDCKRPCFDQLNAHILERLLFCLRVLEYNILVPLVLLTF